MLKIICLLLLSWSSLGSTSYGDWQPDNWYKNQETTSCPSLFPHPLKSFTPRGNLTYGIYKKQQYVFGIADCVASCCPKPDCHVALMYNNSCYHVECRKSKWCMPLYRPELANMKSPPIMVLVKPIEDGVTWSELLPSIDDPVMIEMLLSGRRCSNDRECRDDEICQNELKSDEGTCQCPFGYERDNNKICREIPFQVGKKASDSNLLDDTINTNINIKPKQLVVSVVSKEVRLPENGVTLSAFTVPAEQDNEHYYYAWSLLSQPEGHTGTMADQNRATVKLSNLSEGLYKFRVAVNSSHGNGEAYANVSVLPPKRINQPPIAIVSPSVQIVKLPNTGAVLDGSPSKDDDRVISYHWELKQGPIGYQPNLVDIPTLQLDNLIAGNYSFKLTVEDSDHITNSTFANITVLKVTDYPPSANAGQDIIIYLPQNTITLNGNLSTDDHGISNWEWTKGPSDQNKAVDMQNTRTPYLQLSNLEEGMYTFVLKVEDESEQTSTAEVHVYVKPPTNKPPIANAGGNVTLSLPETRALLDGSSSKDDIKIVSYNWYQISGPSKVEFSSVNQSITNVTKLTKGDYKFKLTVIDDNGNKDSDIIYVRVTQNKNAPPKANAGGDQVVVVPVNALIINGSQSTDDLKIGEWIWTRDPTSLAIGKIIEGTDKSPVLMVTDIVPGRYVFKLKVVDDQGASSEDTVSVIVKPDPELLHLVELTLNIDAHLLTETQKDSLVLKLHMLLHEDVHIVVRNLEAESRTGRARLIFFVQTEQKGKTLSVHGPDVVRRLRKKLRQDSGLLQLSVASIDTVVCQNNCSGHGVCDEESRQCLCEAFWMQNLIQKYFGNGESNCDWSILYVIIALLSLAVCWIAFIWGLGCLCYRICSGKKRSRPKKKPARYSLLQPEAEDDASAFSAHKMVLSDSDTDSDDVLFENRKGKNNGQVRNGKSRNGFLKNGSRIKT